MSTPPNPRPADGQPPGAAAGASHYQLLELPPSASAAELRQAFRRLSKRYHPDTTTLPARQAEEAFRRLQLAYGVLSDPIARRRYDAALLAPPAAAVLGAAVPQPAATRGAAEMPRAVGVRRALSGGEWFALLLLGVALVLSLVLGIGVAWARGTALVRSPSWWGELQAPSGNASPAAPAATPDPAAADGVPAA